MLNLLHPDEPIAPGLIDVSVVYDDTPIGRNYIAELAICADAPPKDLLDAMDAMGFAHEPSCRDTTRVLKGVKIAIVSRSMPGQGFLPGWSAEESERNLALLQAAFTAVGVRLAKPFKRIVFF